MGLFYRIGTRPASLQTQRNRPCFTGLKPINTVQIPRAPKNVSPWAKVAIAVSAVTLLGTYAPVPGLVGQIKALGELRVVTRIGPL